MPIPEITYPCSLLLLPRCTLDQYQLHTTGPRFELPSPIPTRYRSPISRKPMLSLAIQGIQHIEGPIHLRPIWATLTLGFFSFLWVGEFTMKNRSFNPRFHPIEQCGFDAAKFSAASTAARAGLPSDTIQKLVRWRSSAYETFPRHPLIHRSDTRTMAAAQ